MRFTELHGAHPDVGLHPVDTLCETVHSAKGHKEYLAIQPNSLPTYSILQFKAKALVTVTEWQLNQLEHKEEW